MEEYFDIGSFLDRNIDQLWTRLGAVYNGE